MEEEQIVDHTEANDLWCSGEETLKCSKCSEASVIWHEGCNENHDRTQDLGPEEDGKTKNTSATVTIHVLLELQLTGHIFGQMAQQ